MVASLLSDDHRPGDRGQSRHRSERLPPGRGDRVVAVCRESRQSLKPSGSRSPASSSPMPHHGQTWWAVWRTWRWIWSFSMPEFCSPWAGRSRCGRCGSSWSSLAPVLLARDLQPLMPQGAADPMTSRMGSLTTTVPEVYGYRMSKVALNMAGRSLSIVEGSVSPWRCCIPGSSAPATRFNQWHHPGPVGAWSVATHRGPHPRDHGWFLARQWPVVALVAPGFSPVHRHQMVVSQKKTGLWAGRVMGSAN